MMNNQGSTGVRKVIATEYMTLDGVMEAPGESNPSAREEAQWEKVSMISVCPGRR